MQAVYQGSMITLDTTTLFVVATCVMALLGLILVFAGKREGIRALGWWGAAYLVAGLSVAIWTAQDFGSQAAPTGVANAMLLTACGMMWSAARLFHGRKTPWLATFSGPAIWLLAYALPGFDESIAERIVVGSLMIATFVFLTAGELWRERRQPKGHRLPAIVVPMIHGLMFLLAIPVAAALSGGYDSIAFVGAWGTIFIPEMMLYAVAAAFFVLVLANERVVRVHRTAASTDALTGLLNRRALCEGAQQLFSQQARKGEPISVLIFDLDRFKSINDKHGHALGDEALRTFASTIRTNMRATDLFGRLGGEEFAAVVPATLTEAVSIAERVRCAFEASGLEIGGRLVNATVSVGAASGHPARGFDALLARADAALYRAKADGRNRTETMEAGPSFGAGTFAAQPVTAAGEAPTLLPAFVAAPQATAA